jgi:uncharacterized protein involved in response to NO
MDQCDGQPLPAGRGQWEFRRLFSSPHRLAFSAAAFLLCLSSLWWAIANPAFSGGMELRWSMPSAVAHSVVMTFGFMPLFFIGFLYTAAPKWLERPAFKATHLLQSVLPIVAGMLVFMLAIHGPSAAFGRSVGAMGLGAVFIGWLHVVTDIWLLMDESQAGDKAHMKVIAAGCVAGALALGAATAGLAADRYVLVRAAVHFALWAFNGLVFLGAAHRMVPYFSACAPAAWASRWPRGLLWTLAALAVFEAVTGTLDALGGSNARGWGLLRSSIELPAGLTLLVTSARAGLARSLQFRLLAMLHVGYSWLGMGLLMFGISHAADAAQAPGFALGLAPLHAYTMGFLGSTMLAMVTRASCGLGGRTVVADDFVWRLFWVLQAATLLRIAAALTFRTSGALGLALAALAALAWAATFACWAARYGRWYGRPRPDGRAG